MDIEKPIAIVLFALSLYGCAPDAALFGEHARRAEPPTVDSAPPTHAARTPLEHARFAAATCGPAPFGRECRLAVSAGRSPRCTAQPGFTANERAAARAVDLPCFACCASDPAQVPVVDRPVR